MLKELNEYLATALAAVSEMTTAQKHGYLPYHAQRVREFQHERLIHLLVTLFFGLLVVTSVIATIISTGQPAGLLTGLLRVVTLLLLITEICYVIYYFRFENAVQKLYLITRSLTLKISQ